MLSLSLQHEKWQEIDCKEITISVIVKRDKKAVKISRKANTKTFYAYLGISLKSNQINTFAGIFLDLLLFLWPY